jgi:hypothetical protein
MKEIIYVDFKINVRTGYTGICDYIALSFTSDSKKKERKSWVGKNEGVSSHIVVVYDSTLSNFLLLVKASDFLV